MKNGQGLERNGERSVILLVVCCAGKLNYPKRAAFAGDSGGGGGGVDGKIRPYRVVPVLGILRSTSRK